MSRFKQTAIRIGLSSFLTLAGVVRCAGQNPPPGSPQTAPPEKIIIDTDIGDDIDDAFAVALALRSPEFQILGITTTFGDTETRAKLLDRMLGEAGRSDIPVAAGPATPPKTAFTQRRYAEGGHFAKPTHADAIAFLLDQIRQHPGEITLVAIGPLVNVGAATDKELETFRKLKRVVMMGGSIRRGYGDVGYGPPHGPTAEWNIMNDIPSARKLFDSGLPLFVMPLDSTQLKLEAANRTQIFRQGTPLTDALTLLYHEWGQETPTLFDPMTIAFLVKPDICPVVPMLIRVDDQGYTREVPPPKSTGALSPASSATPLSSQNAPYLPNAQVCLESNSQGFFDLLLARLTAP